jgi:putative ABC transport system ATP-binding protein
MNENNHIIEFQHVNFSYSNDRRLLKDLSVVFESGSFNIIKGASGAGKSSLLKLISRLLDPQSGKILFNKAPLEDYPPQSLRRRVIYIQQTPVVVNGSVKDNLLLPFSFKGNHDLSKPDDTQLKRSMTGFYLDQIDLNRNTLNLSVGQQQRLCLIRGLLLSPEVILLDEPTSALDEESGRIVDTSIVRLCRESGLTVIMVSHKNFNQDSIKPRVLELKDGKIREV